MGAQDTRIVRQSGVSASVSFNRPNDTNAYTAGDVVGSSTAASGAVLEFDFVDQGGAAFVGGQLIVTTAALRQAVSAIPSGETSFRLYLYNVTPPSALGDNAAWDLVSGDYASFTDNYIDLGTPVDLGSTALVKTDGINTEITVPSSGKLFAYMVTNGGFTPAASTAFKIDLEGTPV